MGEKLRKSGISIIGNVPWGTHFCQFYRTKEDLVEILVPYFTAGLENNELCLWITSHPLEVDEGKEALRRAVPDIDIYLESGQIEIIPSNRWYVEDGIFDSKRVLNGWIEKLDQAVAKGYDGLRLSRNTFWLEEKDWDNFVDYEEEIDNIIGNYRMIALCTYSLDRCSATEIIDVVTNHQFALVKKEGKWEQVESSKRRKAEEEALQAAKSWKYTFDAVPDLIAILDNEYRIVRVNRAMAARLKMKPEECAGLTCYRVMHGTDSPPSSCPHQQLLKDGLEHTVEVHEDGLGGDFTVSVSPLHDSEGKLTGCIHIARDITKRKRAEEALLEGEERLRFALETIHAGAWDLDLVDHTAHRSLEHDRIFGYEQLLPQWTYEIFLDHVLPEDRAMVDAKFRKATTTRSDWSFECRIRRVDGKVRWIWAAGRHRLDATGSVRRMGGIVQDITERKQLEEQTRQRAEEIETVMEVAPVAIWIGHDPLSHKIIGNKMANELYGAKTGENVSANITPLRRFFHESRELTADELPMQEAILKDIDVRNAEIDVLLPGGEWRAILGSASPLHDTEGHVRGSVATFIDITERKEAENKLKETLDNLENLVKERTVELENAYRSLKESEKGLAEAQKMAHIGNWNWNIIDDKIYWSDEMYRIFGLDPQEFYPTYNAFLSYVHPDDRASVDNALKRALDGRKPDAIDCRILLANGKQRATHSQVEVIFNEKQIPVQVRGIVQDITEKKEAEEAFLNAVTTRKKEIHHRIKNNLQVISSLLDLQAEKFKNKECIENSEVLETFRESRDRVISIALIHEELHEGEGADTLDFSTYIRELTENLFQTYRYSDKNIHLIMDLEENIFFDMDTAVPLGIIVNELVSNSLKHAFSGRDRGEIRIKLRRDENGEHKKEGNESISFTLTVSDNGVGIPENPDLENPDSLGIRLITILVDQLDGRLQLKRNNGTEFAIRFTVTEKE